MKNDPEYSHRRSIRLRNYDYSQAGAYYVTICTRDRECLFGEIVDGEMRLNEMGQIITGCWDESPNHFPNVKLDAFVVMPNHVHGIIVIVETSDSGSVGARHAVPLQRSFGQPISGSLPTIIRSFKSAVTRRINEMRDTPGMPVWQRNYYEHVIRNNRELDRVRRYIAGNPARWTEDSENPANWL
jgi:REP element-mobilizing transposase RayT